MPTAPLRYCAEFGCTQRVRAGRCPKHERKDWEPQYTAKRVRGRKLQKLRLALIARQPFCARCKTRVTEIRDHVIPLAEGGQDVESNVQGLCADCHEAKSQAEAARGRARSR